MIKILKAGLLIFPFLFAINQPLVHAEDLECEVMSLEGAAYVTNGQANHQPLREGDILKAGDLVEVGANSHLDVGYDKNWQNVTRIEENSKIEIKSLFPTAIKLASGGIYAKLRELPKDSTFEVETPTAIASVRGTEYRTEHQDAGTKVYNFSDSKVYVFGQDGSGKINETPTIIRNSEVTRITDAGSAPTEPKIMSDTEHQKGFRIRQDLQGKIQDNIRRGRFAKVQDMRAIEKIHRERMTAAHSGQGRLVSVGSGQSQNGQTKDAMDREDRMLRVMDNADKMRQQGPPQSRGPEQRGTGMGQGPQNQDENQRPDADLKKNDEKPLDENGNGDNPNPKDDQRRKPRPGNLPLLRPPR